MDEMLVDGYRALTLMQTGQNSQVWEVMDEDTKQRFAMKMLLPEKVAVAEQRQLLAHEARVGRSLDHPKIIRFFQYSANRKMPYILMEYFPSTNLKLRIMRKEDTLRARLRLILDQSAEAISFLHSKGWVHRDIKPDNIIMNGAFDVRLIDFALAVRKAGFWARQFARRSKTAGTRSYMSPEQIRGLPVDHRADVYSFGVMTYEIIAGKLPFVARTANDLLRLHLNAEPPPFDRAKGVTAEFDHLLRRMLAKREVDRLQSLDEFRGALRSVKIFHDEVVEQQAVPRNEGW